MRYPIYFLNKDGAVVATISTYKSYDDTPRYFCNPKSPDNTYCLQDCLKDWKPVYKILKGDIVKWKEYTLEVITVKVKNELIRCKGYYPSEKTISWKHWLEFSDVELIKPVNIFQTDNNKGFKNGNKYGNGAPKKAYNTKPLNVRIPTDLHAEIKEYAIKRTKEWKLHKGYS